MIKVIALLFIFFLTATTILLGLVYMQEVVGDTTIQEFNKSAQNIMSQQGYNYQNETAALAAKYQLAKINYDWAFAFFWVILEVSIIVFAIKAPTLPNFDFFTILVFGSIMFLFGYSFVADINNWLFQNFLVNVFSSDVTYMPLYNFFNNNQISIVFINFVGALLINFMFSKGEKVSLTNT